MQVAHTRGDLVRIGQVVVGMARGFDVRVSAFGQHTEHLPAEKAAATGHQNSRLRFGREGERHVG